jgi:hypothetical protein
MPEDSEILEYRAATLRNREVFLLNYAYAFHAFDFIDQRFTPLLLAVGTQRGKDGQSRVGLVPFLAIAQRQARGAFDLLSFHQSYQAWILLRVCLEVTLIIGKWMDDPEHANTWARREEEPKRYRKEFSGESLRSKSLPRSAEIQTVLKRINDEFLHPNPSYYRRHFETKPLDDRHLAFIINYFDSPEQTEGHALAILHLLVLIQDSLIDMLKGLYPTLDAAQSPGSKQLQKELGPRAKAFCLEHSELHSILLELGLWPHDIIS